MNWGVSVQEKKLLCSLVVQQRIPLYHLLGSRAFFAQRWNSEWNTDTSSFVYILNKQASVPEYRYPPSWTHHCSTGSSSLYVHNQVERWWFNISLDFLVLRSWFKMNLELFSEQKVLKPKPAKVQAYWAGLWQSCFRVNIHELISNTNSSLS